MGWLVKLCVIQRIRINNEYTHKEKNITKANFHYFLLYIHLSILFRNLMRNNNSELTNNTHFR